MKRESGNPQYVTEVVGWEWRVYRESPEGRRTVGIQITEGEARACVAALEAVASLRGRPRSRRRVAIPDAAAVSEVVAARLVSDLELSVRTQHCLGLAGIRTVGELARLTFAGVAQLRHSSRRVAREVEEVLASIGVPLAAAEPAPGP